ncbi:MAG: hypothetical protein R1F52_06015 [Candidatus Nitrosoabyssus spongiisocia]|nr:MAG: hypothetical protein R1F52_06015 [Nitrosopumilaceae archaeon AB1(1)]
MERSNLKLCKYYDSGKIKKDGFRKNKSGKVQIFECLECNRKFTVNFGFGKMEYTDKIITGAMQMYFSGMSVRQISKYYEMMDVDTSYRAIYDWVAKYSTLISVYLDSVVPRTKSRTMIRGMRFGLKLQGIKNTSLLHLIMTLGILGSK